MATNKQRRDAERLRLQRQLEERRRREAARRRTNIIVAVVGSLVLVAGIVAIVAVATSGNGKKKTASRSGVPTQPSTAAPTSQAPSPSPTADPVLTTACAAAPKGSNATFMGVTVTGATNLKADPTVKSKSSAMPKTVECEDLVVGTGQAATPTSNANVKYVGALLKDGSVFDASSRHGSGPANFPLGNVVSGFRLGIGGSGKVTPMRVGGRRLLILPPSFAYGDAAQQGIPANSTLIFIVDLASIGS